MEETADVSVMGCGWLGLPLAEHLVQLGYRVKGTTTTPEKLPLLAQKQIQPYLLHLLPDKTDAALLASFLNAKVLVLNIPPRLRAGEGAAYLAQLQQLATVMAQAPVEKLLFISSTAVYPDLNRSVSEADSSITEARDPGNVLLQAEKLVRENARWQTTIVRFCGLYGGSRHPGRFMAGKINLPNAEALVNLIHQEDCVAILTRIIQTGRWGEVYNACADEHPTRKAFYTHAAQAIGATPPTFTGTGLSSFKSISSQKLKEELNYQFRHPNPMTGI